MQIKIIRCDTENPCKPGCLIEHPLTPSWLYIILILMTEILEN